MKKSTMVGENFMWGKRGKVLILNSLHLSSPLSSPLKNPILAPYIDPSQNFPSFPSSQ